MKSVLLITLGAAVTLVARAHPAGSCDVASGAATAALVELYTSEGCSSCPPADRQLSSLQQQLDSGAVVVPLGLHVTYWDRLGWRDPYAQALFDQRQRELLAHRRNRVLYTPQFFVNGIEVRDWPAALPAAIRRINAQPAPVAIRLRTTADAAGLTLEADASASAGPVDGELYLAISESGLVSNVLRGENGGVTLRHDHTARQWLGPFPLRQGKVHVRQQVPLPAAWARDRVQVVALVQDRADQHMLQAVSTQQCTARAGAQ